MNGSTGPGLKSSPVITRCPANPLLSYKDVPYHATLIFNAGACKYQGRYVMAFRNDFGRWGDPNMDGGNIGLAYSADGIKWDVQPKPCFSMYDGEILRAYDPRLTVIDGVVHMCFAVETRHGLCGGIARTTDFDKWEVMSISAPDNRNMVLFPEKIGGKYIRLERPMPVYSRNVDRFDMWLSDSPDLKYWGSPRLVMAVEDVPYANNKIGPAAPPIKTKKGWLTTIHAVDRDTNRTRNGWEAGPWQKRYTAGICLLDLERPWKVIGMSKEPLMAPETPYECEGGYRNYVIFPGGMILEDTGEVKIYYGAADTYECLATAHIDDLLALCKPCEPFSYSR